MIFDFLFPKKSSHQSPRFTLTIDVEIDAGEKWKTRKPFGSDGVLKGLPRLQEVLERHGAKCTLFISSAVLLDEKSVDYLKRLNPDIFELGTHLHGDYIQSGQFVSIEEAENIDPIEMQCELSYADEFQKLKLLTEKFELCFGKRPQSFRAGRFGAGKNTISILKDLGYKYDSSVTPFRNWYGKSDYSKAQHLEPYPVSLSNLLKSENSGIIEVPVSITKDLKWLRPTPSFENQEGLRRVVEWYEKKIAAPTLNCMFHNVELCPKTSPYCATEQDVQILLDRLEFLLKLLKEKKYQFLRICDIGVDKK